MTPLNKRVQKLEHQINAIFKLPKVVRVIQHEGELLEDLLVAAGHPIEEENRLVIVRKIMPWPKRKNMIMPSPGSRN